MPLRDRVTWGHHNPFSDPPLANRDRFVRATGQHRPLPAGGTGGAVFGTYKGDVPTKPYGYYREYDLVAPTPDGRGKLRLVLGAGSEVYVTGNHYDDFRQVINMPS